MTPKTSKEDDSRIEFLVTGCGRSGTQYASNRIAAAGIPCHHERRFTAFGHTEIFDSVGECSWYAAPFLDRLPPGTPVLHIVRSPEKVVDSFARIGLMAKNPATHITHGDPTLRYLKCLHFNPRRLYRRTRYVFQHRIFLNRHTTCLTQPAEMLRLWCYWTQWNLLIEDSCKALSLPYLRVKLETLDDAWDAVASHLGLTTSVTSGAPQNLKRGYVKRRVPYTPPPDETVQLARRYGYTLPPGLNRPA